MRTRLIPVVAALACTASPTTAHAAGAVYGGSTSGREPIVITADKAMKKITSAAVSWAADCDNQMRFPFEAELRPAASQPGFTPGPDALVMSRNAKGRFAGVTVTGGDSGGQTVVISLSLDGKLSAKRASGRLSGTVKIQDAATASAVVSCTTGTMRWSATRAPGTVFGGTTSQDAPVVLRVDARRRKVSDLMLTWHSQTCTPEDFVRLPDDVGNFKVSGSGAFGASFPEEFPRDGGGKDTLAYRVAGRIGRTAARGTYQVTETENDASGAQTGTCDTGHLTWQATTG